MVWKQSDFKDKPFLLSTDALKTLALTKEGLQIEMWKAIEGLTEYDVVQQQHAHEYENLID